MALQVLDGDDASSSSGDSDFGDKVKTYFNCSCCLLSLLTMYLVVVIVVVVIIVVVAVGVVLGGVCISPYMLYAITFRRVVCCITAKARGWRADIFWCPSWVLARLVLQGCWNCMSVGSPAADCKSITDLSRCFHV